MSKTSYFDLAENDYEYLMDETDAPYEENGRPIPRTIEDDLFLLKICKDDGLELKPDSNLYKLAQIK